MCAATGTFWQLFATCWHTWQAYNGGMDRLTWPIVGGVLALVAVGLIAAAVTRDHAPPPDLSTPSGVVVAYAAAEQRGDGSAAWSLLARTAQARGDRDHFVAGASTSRGTAYVTTENERIEGNSASVVLVRTETASGGLFDRGSYTTRNTVILVREDGNWRLSVPPDEYLLFRPKGVQP
jgi:hypothetical protein